MMTKTIDELVNRFLRWKLPKGFSPDGGISFKRIPDFPELNKWEYWKPVGKNLFSAEQAKAMFEYLLADEQAILSQGETVAWRLTHFDGSYEIVTNESWQKVKKSEPLYLAPQYELFGKVEQLKIDNAELIEYAKWLAKHLTIIKNSINSNDYHKMLSNTAMASLAKEALDNPQPKCMGNK